MSGNGPIGVRTVRQAAYGVTAPVELSAFPRCLGARQKISLLHSAAEVDPRLAVGDEQLAYGAESDVALATLRGADHGAVELVLVRERLLTDVS